MLQFNKTLSISILLLIVGALINIPVYRAFSVADVVALVFFISSIWKRQYVSTSWRNISILVVLFCVSLSISDHLADGIDFSTISNVIKYLTIIPLSYFFCFLIEKRASAPAYILVGYALGRALIIEINDLHFWNIYDYWRHGIGEGVGLAIVCCAVHLKSPIYRSIIIIGGVTLFLFVDYRTMVLTYSFTGVLLVISWYLRIKDSSNTVRPFFILSASLMIFVLALIISHRDLTNDRQRQSNSVRMPMLVYNIKDVVEFRFFGNGYNYFMKYFDTSQIDTYDRKFSAELAHKGLRQHGYLFVANTEGGKMGLVLFAYIYYVLFSAFRILNKALFLNKLFISSIPIMVQACLGSLLFVFFEFDRFLLALSVSCACVIQLANAKYKKNINE